MGPYTSSSSEKRSESFSSRSTSPKSSTYPNASGDITSPIIAPMEPIAIIGMSVKLPGDAVTVDSFWDMMMDARSTASKPPSDRFNHVVHHSSEATSLGTIRPQKAHFLEKDWAAFDANFFGLTAAEAKATDPQQRGLLETSYRALENAGIPLSKVYGSDTSVHVGCFTADYLTLMAKDPEVMPKYAATGVAAAFLSNRISSFYNLLGPSVTVDTACSSSLVALDQACQILQTGQSSMGIVAGCNLIFALDLTIALSNMGFLSPDGVCHSFDHRANGYARGEGFGVIVIKRLQDAVRDGDTIRAVIRATGVNQDGNTPLAQPSKVAQARLIAETYRKACLHPLDTKYVEAHGTGTAVGDPLEASAIGTCFAAGRPKTDAIYVSSLKANFGHLEGAAGIAGVIKTVLVLERGIIPPLAGLEKVNPEIDTEFLNIKFPLKPTPWPSRGLRRASVNSFGFGGTNAHAILEDAYHYMQQHGIRGKNCTNIKPPELHQDSRSSILDGIDFPRSTRPLILTWSAYDDSSIKSLVSEHLEWLRKVEQSHTHIDISSSLAHTLNERRSLHSWRTFAITNPLTELATIDITQPIASQLPTELSLAFIFTGQGAQWCGMGRELFVYEVFRQSVLDAISYLMDLGCYWHFAGAFVGELEPVTRLDEPGFAQPICTILQVALVELLASVDIRPSVVIGHSSGEIAAAFASGAISRESAWKLAYYRGICSNEVAAMPNVQGRMLAVGLSEEETQGYVDNSNKELGGGNLTVACINSPSSVTVSGDKRHIDALAAQLEHDSVFARALKVPVAYHGPHMELVASRYLDLIGEIGPGKMPPRHHVNMVSTVSGERIELESLRQPTYWVQNLVSQVRFATAVQATFAPTRRKLPNKLDLSHQKVLWATDVLEIGPHAALGGPIRQSLQPIPHGKDITYASILVRNKDAHVSFLKAAGELHCRGYKVHLSKLNGLTLDKSNSIIALPSLPQYPFNHLTKFWFESRISRGTRFREHGRRPFLGTPVADWNPLDARWRQFLKPADSSWISDHIINGKNLFPAAGMLTMVIEAAAELAGSSAISAFEICDTDFHSALDLPAHSEGVEVQLQLVAHKNVTHKYGTKYDWFLRAYQEDWHDICCGTVRTVPASEALNEVDNGNEEEHLGRRALAFFDDISRRCSRDVNGAEIYDHFWKCGYHFGPSFKRIQSSKHSTLGQATAKIAILSEQSSEKPSVIHPTTLDGMLQIVLPVITDIGTESKHATSLPTRINRLWISKSGWLHENTETIDVAVDIRKSGFRNSTADIAALSQDHSGRVFAEGVETTLITDRLEEKTISPLLPPLCWNLVQKIDLGCVEPRRLHALLTEGAPRLAASRRNKADLDSALYYFIKKTNDGLSELQMPKDGYIRRYYEWMQYQLAKVTGTSTAIGDTLSPSLFRSVQSEQPKTARLCYLVGEHLLDLLKCGLDPLSVLFEGTHVPDFYEEILERSDYMVPVARYLDLLTHKNPDIAILEVGAGTGGATKHLMKSLTQRSSNGNTAKYSRYCFTDISASFFAQAQIDLAPFPKLDYKTLDLERDLLGQSFEPESFDVIVASLVLHATSDIDRTLTHLRRLLKRGGKLIAIEVTAPDQVHAGFVFGLLPGWWLGKDECRKDRLGPCLIPDEWDHALSRNGFSGFDHIFWDTPDEEHRLTSLWISTKLEPGRPQIDHACLTATFVRADGADKTHIRLCQKRLKDLGVPWKIANFNELAVEDLNDTIVIIYDSPSSPILQNLNEADFDGFRTTLTQSRNVLWISTALGKESNPSSGAIYGLARTLKSEASAMRFTVFQADISSDLEDQSSNLGRVLAQCLQPFSEHCETELMERDGMLHTCRVVEDVHLSTAIPESGKTIVERDVTFRDVNLCLTVKTPGLLDSLQFIQASPLPSNLGPTDIEVRVKAVGVNFKDCLVALGRVSDDTLGTECAGIVERVGSSSCFQTGDRVVVLALDTYRSVVRCDEALIARIPDDVPFTEAAKLPTNYVTAYHALVELGRISDGESILIHSGAGGTGQAAIQIAKHFGAEVFVTVSSQSKKDLLITNYAIPEDHIFYSRDTSFSQSIKHITNGRGVDIILNSLAGEQLQASWECIAPYGRFFEIGKKDIFSHEKLPMFQFAQNVSFSAIDIAAMTKERPKLVQKSLKAVLDLLAQKKISVASPLKVFDIHGIEEAFRYLQSGKSVGGAVIEIDQDAAVPALVDPQRGDCFKADATYVIAGGLGGQGKSIAKWMGTKGARNLVILSRKGMRSTGAMAFIEEMASSGTSVNVEACDISNATSLRTTIESLSNRMPPIKGCIQAAMVIEDTIFSSMTYSQWTTALGPKINGSWNLHTELPQDLDFFVLLSSSAGLIGSGGQANYCAGNTYQDSLAAYRLSQNLRAVSIDMSLMKDEGYFVGRADVLDQFARSKQLRGMSQRDLFTVLQHYCNPDLKFDEMRSQIAMGFSLPSDVKGRGDELASWMEQPLFSHLHQIESSTISKSNKATNGSMNPGQDDISTIAALKSRAKASSIITRAIQNKFSQVFSRATEQIDTAEPIHTHGVDSLIAVELRNWLIKRLSVDVSVFEILGGGSIEALSASIVEKLGIAEE